MTRRGLGRHPTGNPEAIATTDARAEPAPEPSVAPRTGHLGLLTLGALGIVYGDIGTSPLYAVRESFSGHFGVAPTPENVLGVASLIAWALVLIVSIKYLTLVLRADNEGEGGILALVALIDPRGLGGPIARNLMPRRLLLVTIGLFGAALLFGDGILTPAISVLSAVEGLEVAAPRLEPYVVPLTVAILLGLFLFQHHGTTRVGRLFGPITLVWFAVLAALGLHGIVQEPGILAALHPIHGIRFLLHGGMAAVHVLGAVFLVVTGAEALYADMGHFGKGPIRLAWYTIVFPALLLNYFGQSALLLGDPSTAASPFFLLAPEWARLGLVALATLATIIASQAVISGVYSLANQAVQLGYWPRLEIRHTSATEYGQIYVPAANWALMVLTIILVLEFGSSSALAGAYGIAIVGTMLVTTILLFVVAPARWGWPPALAWLVLGFFLAVELGFFGANILKLPDGGYVPLLLGGALFFLTTTWQWGRRALGRRIGGMLQPLPDLLESLANQRFPRVPGTAVYMTGNADFTPPPLVKNLEHQKTLHERVLLLTVANERVPYVRPEERLRVHELGQGFYRVAARYGFLESPDMVRIFRRLKERGLDIPLAETTFFLGRERVLPRQAFLLTRIRTRVFGFMTRNSQRATAFFNIPSDRVVEVGSQIEV